MRTSSFTFPSDFTASSRGLLRSFKTAMSDIEELSQPQKRRRVDSGVKRSTYGQNTTLAHATAAAVNGVAPTGNVLRSLLKGSSQNTESLKKENGASIISELLKTAIPNKENTMPGHSASHAQNLMEIAQEEAIQMSAENTANNGCNGNGMTGGGNGDVEMLQAKRARVENIITNMRQSPSRSEMLEPNRPRKDQERERLKQQLHEMQQQMERLQKKYFELYEQESSAGDDSDVEVIHAAQKEAGKANHHEAEGGESQELGPSHFIERARALVREQEIAARQAHLNRAQAMLASISNNNQRSNFGEALKDKLTKAVTDVVDSVVREYFPSQPTSQISALHHTHSSGINGGLNGQGDIPRQSTEALPLVVSRKKEGRLRVKQGNHRVSSNANTHSSSLANCLPTSVAIPNPSLQQTLPIVSAAFSLHHHDEQAKDYSARSLESQDVPTPLTDHQMLSNGSPSMGDVHHAPEGLSLSLLKAECGELQDLTDLSAYGSPKGSPPHPGSQGIQNSSLTPTHLKKAKLMFFYTRYPSSSTLKQHFPDVKFNRCITSQLIKWFSNFREFYYIQMEKFARQAMSEGLETKDLHVTRDSELFHALNLHYNKSNEFKEVAAAAGWVIASAHHSPYQACLVSLHLSPKETRSLCYTCIKKANMMDYVKDRVPDSFLVVAEQTLSEFFNAIKAGKDLEASWKKNIYKIISKLDSPLPEIFQSPDCMKELLGE
ncbi:Prospero homeobox protein 1 [Branchiostoma belcheri]|nr:Prospero homeobox protein 1 [Branchiostoma belcheri]